MSLTKRYMDKVYEILEENEDFRLLSMDDQGTTAVRITSFLIGKRVLTSDPDFEALVKENL